MADCARAGPTHAKGRSSLSAETKQDNPQQKDGTAMNSRDGRDGAAAGFHLRVEPDERSAGSERACERKSALVARSRERKLIAAVRVASAARAALWWRRSARCRGRVPIDGVEYAEKGLARSAPRVLIEYPSCALGATLVPWEYSAAEPLNPPFAQLWSSTVPLGGPT
jgi:hypothetical protein